MRKFAFSTLACPAWSIDQVVDAATRHGYDGVELRLLDGEVIDPGQDGPKVARAVARCRDAGVAVCALDTSCRLNQTASAAQAKLIDELMAWLALARDVAVPIIRVFGGEGDGEHTEAEQNAVVARTLRSVIAAAEAAAVTVALETHDAFASARRVANVLDAVPSPRLAAIWDSHHPYRVGESAAEVARLLGPRIAHVHVKDARRAGDGWQLVPIGEGEVPVRAQLQALESIGYEGYVSVEWEKKWHPELAVPEIALPQHIRWLRSAV